MNFYADPAFFVLLVPIVALAFVLGFNERPLKGYACVVSAVMLFILFSRSLASLGFLAAFLVLSCVLMRFVGSRFASNDPHAVALYRVALALQIAPLAIYKTSVVFGADFFGFIGISYITFKTVQVLIEMRDGLIDRIGISDYLAFLIFFPTFTSGPIMRSRTFLADTDKPLSRDGYLARFYRGCGWFILGTLYKFVGSSLALWFMWFAPAAIGSTSAGAAFLSQLAYGLGYGLDLFFDFAGYSDMAVGLGLMMGVEVPRNFRAPFKSIDIKDFWNRWHITLSYWLRDYVFMRLSKSLISHKVFKSRVTTACVAFIANMTLMGMWHGLTFDYILYGFYHGLLLAGCELIQKKWGFYRKHRNEGWFKGLSWLVTMIAVFFGFSIFSGQLSSLLFGSGIR